MYAVVCPEHGGFVVRNAPEAIEAATEACKDARDCDYYPIIIGLAPQIVAGIFAPPPEVS
jgi:hypothetical protein